ncbi:hypothetical protein TWF730_007397 [Orbilia blumenaviensis]|uniref:RZ-type domain-containing protein n=1 Tax=Orbilia blumenaviensis TaxID=1796055 RepID=A0AAV9V8D0_9PEZI
MADNGATPNRRPPQSHRRRHSNYQSNQPSGENSQGGQSSQAPSGPRRHSGGQHNYQQQKHGPKGKRHSFSHNPPPPPTSPGNNFQNAGPNPDFRSRARFKLNNNWNSNGPNQASNNDLSPTGLQEYLSAGLEKIRLSEDSRQGFIGHLASQNGLEKVRQLLEAEYATSYSVTRLRFATHCVDFLRVISNKTVLSSLSLEQQVRTVYNVVYGFNGERAVPFFDRVLECLTTLKPDDDPGSMEEEDWNYALEVTTSVFLNTLRMNQGAAIHEKMKYLGQRLAEITQIDAHEGDKTREIVLENISNITSILSAGAEVPRELNSRDVKKKFPKEREEEEDDVFDFPGELSLIGPRHDNDHEMISKISILPTVSEILCDRSEFLPTTRAYEENAAHHQQGIHRLVDIQFRLLREDTSGQVRNTVRFLLNHWEEIMAPVSGSADWQAKRKLVRDGCPTPLRLYFGVDIQNLKFEGKGGLEAMVEFDQPRALRRWTLAKRQWWWRKSTELRENKSIMALIEKNKEDTNVVFLLVCHRNVPSFEQSNAGDPSEPKAITDLCTDPDRAVIGLRMIALGEEKEQARLIHLATKYSAYHQQRALLMVEFPAVLYRNFQGILRCLQTIHENPTQLPFGKWLSPRLEGLEGSSSDQTIGPNGSLIPPPSYFSGQFLDLSACCNPPPGAKVAPPNTLTFTLQDDEETVIKNLAQQSTLDHGQATAMISAFRHQVALTQGPPGCGKSYVGVKMVAALLANKARLNLGPILCICYTNHALDQFLNELLKLGIKNIARIGSPSPLPHIETLSFDNYKKGAPRIQIPGYGQRFKAARDLKTRLETEISKLCSLLEANSVEMVIGYLEKHLPQKLQDIINGAKMYGIDGASDDRAQAIILWTGGTSELPEGEDTRPLEQLLELPAWSLNLSERYKLFEHCQQSVVDELTQKLQASLELFASNKKLLTSLFLDTDRKHLENVDILGITTVGLVNNSELVRTLPAKVMVCEEAGEVLESHILTALLPSIEHLILIGDHLQLRPKISTMSLSKEYERRDKRQFNLDESLFERLANVKFNVKKKNEDDEEIVEQVGFPIGQLDIQRRMHPNIADLVRTTLYPKLHDHEGTTRYPEVAGMSRRLFWLDHRNFEDPGDPGEAMQSKTNTWEAKMVVSLVTYLARQGIYKTGEIAVLTPYINQMRMLMEMFEEIIDYDISERDLEELDIPDDEEEKAAGGKRKPQIKKSKVLDRIRMATVDNFQGEEATVIIVSLVRSNDRQNCGFLKTTNRMNVLLSRAKHGMYIIGDAATSTHVPMWHEVLTLLENSGNIGPRFQLKCPRHPNKKTFVGCPEDFVAECPEGGCSEVCGLRLSCGHVCEFKCHPKPLHENALCFKDCAKPRDCGHSCRLRCKDPCGDCMEEVNDVGLPCGHVARRMVCWRTKDLARFTCPELVEKVMPGCGHTLLLHCFRKNEPNIICTEKCGHPLTCGHTCQRRCNDCTASGTHAQCTTTCGKNYQLCGHQCSKVCHEGIACPPCPKPCELQCKHSKCPNKCGEACYPCAMPCGWDCVHEEQTCTMPCSVPCAKLPCNKRCEKRLKCKHRCPSVCGEKCPPVKYCQECATTEIKNQRVDLISLESYEDVDLNQDPIIVLRCDHIFTMSSLDGFLELDKHYVVNEETGKKRILMSGEALKGCPDCRRPFRDIDRYNRVFKSILLDELTRRFVVRSTTEYADLFGKLQAFESGIEEERAGFLKQLEGCALDESQKFLNNYKRKGRGIRHQIKVFNDCVEPVEQPLNKVNDFYKAALANRGGTEQGQSFDFDKAMIQTGLSYRGKCLDFRAQWLILSDWRTISERPMVPASIKRSLRDSINTTVHEAVKDTATLRKECQEASLLGIEVESRIYHAMFSILEIENNKARGTKRDDDEEAKVRRKELNTLNECENICRKYPGSVGRLKDLLEAAKKVISGGVFYTRVTSDEEAMVISAMAAEFRGSGHWYYCVNGHPFTIGDCGMPMELARCPECGQQIGGQDHTAVVGVRPAEDLEGRRHIGED